MTETLLGEAFHLFDGDGDVWVSYDSPEGWYRPVSGAAFSRSLDEVQRAYGLQANTIGAIGGMPVVVGDPMAQVADQVADMYADLYATPSTVADDAHAAVYGDRQDDYGHPREDFTRTAILWTGLLHHKLADGAHLEPEDIARCMIAVKLARDVHTPKRDNRVDMAGYAITLDRLATGQ